MDKCLVTVTVELRGNRLKQISVGSLKGLTVTREDSLEAVVDAGSIPDDLNRDIPDLGAPRGVVANANWCAAFEVRVYNREVVC